MPERSSMKGVSLSTTTSPTDGETTTKIKFDTRAEYKIGNTTYRVTSHFAESGDDLKGKITRLLKQDLENELCTGLTQPDK